MLPKLKDLSLWHPVTNLYHSCWLPHTSLPSTSPASVAYLTRSAASFASPSLQYLLHILILLLKKQYPDACHYWVQDPGNDKVASFVSVLLCLPTSCLILLHNIGKLKSPSICKTTYFHIYIFCNLLTDSTFQRLVTHMYHQAGTEHLAKPKHLLFSILCVPIPLFPFRKKAYAAYVRRC